MAEPARGVLRLLQSWRAWALLVGACLSIFAAVIGLRPESWSSQELVDLNILFWLRGERPTPPEVVLIPIDARAQEALFLPEASREFERCADVKGAAQGGYKTPDAPDVLTRWPRCLHALALEALAAAEPELVVMDISFRPRSDPGEVFEAQDRRLASAMRKLGKVVLIRKLRASGDGAGIAQPIAAEIESAALATAPFLVLGHRLHRAEKFCTFMDDGARLWPCLPAVVHQIASLEVYPELHRLLDLAGSPDMDVIPPVAAELLAQGALHVPVTLIRRLVMADSHTAERLRGAAHPALRVRRLADIYLGSGTRYFNFYGSPGAFQTLRYESLVAGGDAKLLPGSLRGKIVFIGFAEQKAAEAVDHLSTPFTGGKSVKVSGVELAATAYSNLRDGTSIEPTAGWLRALITVSLGMLCTFFCIAFRPLAAIVMFAGCVAMYLGGALVVFDLHAAWMPLLMPLAAALPATVAGVAARQIEDKRLREEAERKAEHFRRILAELLPQFQARRIIEDGARLKDLELSGPGVSINTDIAGYTRLTAKRPAEEVAALMASYFTKLRGIAEARGVYTFDFAGDSMMASWPNPTAESALRARACTAALELSAASEEFRGVDPNEPHPTRIGMDYGDIEFTMIGDRLHAVGEPPNMAQRLQEINEDLGTRVLASEVVVRDLNGFVVRRVGSFLLRDMTTPTEVCEVLAFEDAATPHELRRLERFGEALDAYRLDQRERAKALFERLSAEKDGPSAYYAALCARGAYFKDQPIPV